MSCWNNWNLKFCKWIVSISLQKWKGLSLPSFQQKDMFAFMGLMSALHHSRKPIRKERVKKDYQYIPYHYTYWIIHSQNVRLAISSQCRYAPIIITQSRPNFIHIMKYWTVEVGSLSITFSFVLDDSFN